MTATVDNECVAVIDLRPYVVTFDGKVPNLRPLAMDADPACAKKHSGPVANEMLSLGPGNTMGNIMVWVSKGLPAGKTWPAPKTPVVLDQKGCVYVPHVMSNDVYVIDPATRKVVSRFPVGLNPQHVVPSYDLTTLWVANNAEGLTTGSLTPVDPTTGKPGKPIPVDDPYNLYFTPDGRSAMVVAEALKRRVLEDMARVVG